MSQEDLIEIKYNKIRDELALDIIDDEFDSKEDLAEYIKQWYGLEGLTEIDESGLSIDFAFLVGVSEDWGYVTIYYKKGYSEILITEVSVSRD